MLIKKKVYELITGNKVFTDLIWVIDKVFFYFEPRLISNKSIGFSDQFNPCRFKSFINT